MSHRQLHADAGSVLSGWTPPDHCQAALREAFVSFVAARPDATDRSCEPGHLTASAVVLNAERNAVLLTLHPRVGRWLQLGGHCEDRDTTLAGAALRGGPKNPASPAYGSSRPRCIWTSTRSPAVWASPPGTSTSVTW